MIKSQKHNVWCVYLIVCCLFVLSGCSKLKNVDQLLTLKALADEKESIDVYLKAQNEKFEQLLGLAKTNSLIVGESKENIRQKFGNPIATRFVSGEVGNQDRWLYRYATEFFNSPKVYLFFDEEGSLVSWEVPTIK